MVRPYKMADPSASLDEMTEALCNPEPAEYSTPNEGELSALPRNDKGNADRLLARYGQDVLFLKEYCREESQAWMLWRPNGKGGGVWKRQAWDGVNQLAFQTAAAILDQEVPAIQHRYSNDLGPDADAEKRRHARKEVSDHIKWGIQSGNQGRSSAMLAAAKNFCVVQRDDLDTDPLAIGVANGVLHLPRPLEGASNDGGADAPLEELLASARREDLMTKASPVVWDSAAEAPRFMQFLKTILPNKQERLFLQRWFGYCMTGLVSEQTICMFYGSGGNGKSTLLNIVRGVLGSYAIGLPFESFVAVERSGGQATPDIARLPAVRLAVSSEPEVGIKLSEATIKAHTGGEKIVVRPLYGFQFEFSPTHKILLSFNQKPRIVGQDDGIWRRIALLEFKVKLKGPKPARPFDQMVLEEESAGVLRWMVDGYLLWRERGLDQPPSVKAATDSYRAESNVLGEFLEAFVLPDETGRVQASRLYDLYCSWATRNAVDPISITRFGKELPERGFQKKTINGRRHYEGVRINPQAEEALADHAEGA